MLREELTLHSRAELTPFGGSWQLRERAFPCIRALIWGDGSRQGSLPLRPLWMILLYRRICRPYWPNRGLD